MQSSSSTTAPYSGQPQHPTEELSLLCPPHATLVALLSPPLAPLPGKLLIDGSFMTEFPLTALVGGEKRKWAAAYGPLAANRARQPDTTHHFC